MQAGLTAVAFAAWQEHSHLKRQHQRMAASAVARMLHRHLSAAFVKWHTLALERRELLEAQADVEVRSAKLARENASSVPVHVINAKRTR